MLFEEQEDGLLITADITGLSEGKHGFHIHEFGLTTNGGKDAGSHYNPDESPHGSILEGDFCHAHAGDLGNLDADANGKAHMSILVPKLSLTTGFYNVAGRSVIIHAEEDRFVQPVGGAGARIGAGTIVVIEN